MCVYLVCYSSFHLLIYTAFTYTHIFRIWCIHATRECGQDSYRAQQARRLAKNVKSLAIAEVQRQLRAQLRAKKKEKGGAPYVNEAAFQQGDATTTRPRQDK